MAYQALYRTWRPQRFEDIAGQEAVTRTLKNALKNHKTSHAYLFTGPRGTGKTSAAKIIAKAINCPNAVDGEPCNDCDLCRAITNGTLGDVIEIDAASNNGVEEIRDIRDKARYAPTQANYKVYIIDEVHMLSTGAFNALLKTLEEPPQNVVFILATTEPHKIPATIISRTQRFDFRRITSEDIKNHMAHILQEEAIDYDPAALDVIARFANGGMRDALSLLDQVISFGNGAVTFEQAIQVSGSLTDEMKTQFLQELWNGQTETALGLFHNLLESGKEPGRFVEEMIEFSRDILVGKQSQVSVENWTMIQVNQNLVDFVEKVPNTYLYQLIEAFNQTQQEMRFTTKPSINLEVFIVKMSQVQVTPIATSVSDQGQVEELQKQMKALENQLAQLKQNGIPVNGAETQTSAPAKKVSTTKSDYKPNLSLIYKVLNQATKQDLQAIREVWPDLLDSLSVTQKAILKASEPVAASKDGFVLKFDYEILCQRADGNTELIEAVKNYCQKTINYTGEYVSVQSQEWPLIRKEYILEKRKLKDEESVSSATEDPENQDLRLDLDKAEPQEEHEIDNLIEDQIIEEEQTEVDKLAEKTKADFGNIVEIRA